MATRQFDLRCQLMWLPGLPALLHGVAVSPVPWARLVAVST